MSFVITADRDGQPGLSRRLVEWVTTGTWDESRAFLTDHADELLTEPAEAALVQLVADNPEEQVLQLHRELLGRRGPVASTPPTGRCWSRSTATPWPS